ncbi:putative Ig domain-containing protein [Arthrobacter sp. NicSoilB8]|uniref:putative Ig domain-containing protein n=1 Tax=Arthrobacter sp. NicSoilB8 TaxID=2830998 RepID=UPI001CC7ADBB|nr:putative Ig domain-containing protein [Arthrobacter sp. NicSoilB8]BCW71642.1 hypothetical protein NicSoilB8_26860 [Arthrobacter sp. NicSoilB8]
MRFLARLGLVGLLLVPLLGTGMLRAVVAPAAAASCQPTTPAPTNSYPGATVVADNFESDSLAPFVVNTSGTGTATISSALAHTGGCAAYLHVTSDAGSLAYLTAPLPAGTPSAYADGWFNITTAGLTGSDVPYFRFFSGTTRIADVYRYNSNGQLWLRVTSPNGTFVYTRLFSSSIPLGSWHHVVMQIVPNLSATTIQVWFDSVLVYSSNQVSTGFTTLSRVQLGSEHASQMGDSYVDDVIIKSGAQAAPAFTAATPPTTATVGAPYTYTFAASGNPAPTFRVNSGSLPAGLSLNTTSGVLSGTPTAAGTATFTVAATNGVSPDAVTPSITITVNQAQVAPVFTAATPPTTAAVGAAYTYTFAASGSPAPTFRVNSGSLPAGLSLNATTGILSGTPTTAGTATFTVAATNGVSPDAVTPSITITVDTAQAAPAFTAATPPTTATVGAAYTYTFAASGSPAPTFRVSSGTLPAGLSLNATTGVLSGTPTKVATWDHIVILVEENQKDTSILGNPSAPYLNSLATSGANMTQTFAEAHPSQPNYLALFSGSTQGITDDSYPHSFTTTMLEGQLKTAGKTFTGFAEGQTSGTNYLAYHSPWNNWASIPSSERLDYSAWPTDFTTLPTVSFVVPDSCNSMHDCSIGTGDTWAMNHMDTYLQWAKTHNSLLITTWDENDSSVSPNKIATFFNGANVLPGNYTQTINHYSMLGLIQDAYGLPRNANTLGVAALAAPFSGTFTVTATNGASPDAVTAPITIHVNPAQAAPAFTAATPPTTATVGAPYTYTFAASGNPAPTFRVNSGSLPAGLSLNTTSGVLSGTPTAAGTATFTVAATNGVSPDAVTPSITITVNQAQVAPVFTAATPPTTAAVGAAYTYTFAASGNPAPTFRVNSGALPAGLSLNTTTGILSGTPTAAGTATFTVAATNGVSPDAVTPSITITVNPDTTAPTAPTNLSAVAGSGQIALAWSASTDNVGVTRYNISRNGAPIGTATGTTFADGSVVSGTTYSYTVTAQDAAGNLSAPSNTATATASGVRTITVDRIVTAHQGTNAATVSASGLTTTGSNQLLLAFISSDGPSGGGTESMRSVSGGGLTWTLRRRTNAQAGTAEIWQAVSPAPLANVTITATQNSGTWQSSMTVVAFNNADTTNGATAGASAASGPPSASLTTTRAGSWVWGVGTDWDAPLARTVGPAQTLVDQYLPPAGDTYWVQRQAGLTATSGTVVAINDTAPTTDRWNLALIEIRAAP